MSGTEEQTGFRIDGAVYDIPALDSFDMDEAQVLYDYSGLAIEDFVPLDDEASDEEKEEHTEKLSQKVKNPAFLRAIMHIAYRRGNPKLPKGRIEDVIRVSNHLEAMGEFLRDSVNQGDDPRIPPVSATEPQLQSDSSSVASSASSGDDSKNDSGAPAETPEPTGITRSDTSVTLNPTTSAS